MYTTVIRQLEEHLHKKMHAKFTTDIPAVFVHMHIHLVSVVSGGVPGRGG